MIRRDFMKILLGSAVALPGCRYYPDEGFDNPCLDAMLPESLKDNEWVAAAWEGIDTSQVWDCHSHLIGLGDGDSGTWVNPDMQSIWHPIQYTQFKFYIDGSCARKMKSDSVDEGYLNRLLNLLEAMPTGFRFMLLAFDYAYNQEGKPNDEDTPFHCPNEYALKIARNYPDRCEWIASIHPYRKDAIETLEWAVQHNARAVKWLPSVMGIDGASDRCDRFYETLVKYQIPLLTHSGVEHAVDTPYGEGFNNPLKFRRALEHGVKVIFAHCATLGESVDIDKGKNGPEVANLELFGRLMADHQYEGRVLGDISAITQVNRDPKMIEKIVKMDEWHDRLVYGSDYPLPGVMPVFSPRNFVNWGYISEAQASFLSKVRQHNPILFDIMLKRFITIKGKRFKPSVFESRRHFIRENIVKL